MLNQLMVGNAKSNGNPYGSAASVGVFLVPMIFLRLFAPPQYLTGAILTVVSLDLKGSCYPG